MVTFAQAQERAEEWINGDVPAYLHREVRVREFARGFVVWAEDREEAPTSDGGRQRLVIARDSGEATLWPGLPVGEVIRRYEEEYGAAVEAAPVPAQSARIDLNQTSFLLTPPEWLQEAADKIGLPPVESNASQASAEASPESASSTPVGGIPVASGSDEASVPAAAAAGAGVPGVSDVPGVSGAEAEAEASTVGSDGSDEAVAPASASAPAPASASASASDAAIDAVAAGDSASATDSVDGGAASAPAADAAPEPEPEPVPASGPVADSTSGPVSEPVSQPVSEPVSEPAPAGAPSAEASDAPWSVPSAAAAGGPVGYEPTANDGVPAQTPPSPQAPPAPSAPSSPWADANASSGGADGAVPLPATVFAPPLSGADDEDAPPPVVGADAPTALMKGGSALPATAIAPRLNLDAPHGQGGGPALPPQPSNAPHTPAAPPAPPAPGTPPPAPAAGPGAADIADAATSKATTPPPGGYVRTQLVSQLPDGSFPGLDPAPAPAGPGAPTPPGPPGPPPPPGSTPPPAVHHAATMLARPDQMGPGGPGAPGGTAGGPGVPPPPPPPGVPGGGTPAGGVAHAATMLARPDQMGPGAPGAPGTPGAPGGTAGGPGVPPPPPPPGVPGGGTPAGGIEHAATMLAQPSQMGGPAGPPPPPPPGVPAAMQAPVAPQPAAYGYPQPQPSGMPTVGPGYQAVLRYRAPDGSEQQIIRRSAPGTPHPEWQILHELRAMNVPPQQVLELHTELESCELPGGYCARMIRETWPQARITNIAPYGRDHAGRQQGMRQLLTHQGELHQVADGPARPAPVRAPLPQVQPAPPLPPDGVAQELAGAFGPGILRFDQRAVSRQGVPELVAVTLVWSGLPADFGPFFWAQPAMPVVPTLAELAAQRQVQPAADAGSYLVLGSDFGRAICVQYGTANIVAVPVEAGPGGQSVPPQFVNTGLPEFVRCLALLGRMWRLRFGLSPEQAGRWTVDFQAQLAMLDPAALASPENWWSVLLEQMWDGLL
ncbi:SUKH-4 family immunity protein [Streptomyces roseicoloratus]|uniref:SUKH-4 family immunity protein n=1 Tax=Streptomyces roseicoloratus TaxID=2508722 RepID=UPI001009A0BA|nr:SUKH-4 family immunity protein [Streptomyces roseicoloratus]